MDLTAPYLSSVGESLCIHAVISTLIRATVGGCVGFMFTGAAVVSGAGDGNTGMLEGLIIEKLNGWDIEKR